MAAVRPSSRRCPAVTQQPVFPAGRSVSNSHNEKEIGHGGVNDHQKVSLVERLVKVQDVYQRWRLSLYLV
jgi:hypothetical protein